MNYSNVIQIKFQNIGNYILEMYLLKNSNNKELKNIGTLTRQHLTVKDRFPFLILYTTRKRSNI